MQFIKHHPFVAVGTCGLALIGGPLVLAANLRAYDDYATAQGWTRVPEVPHWVFQVLVLTPMSIGVVLFGAAVMCAYRRAITRV